MILTLSFKSLFFNAATVSVPNTSVQEIHIAAPNPFSASTRFEKPGNLPDDSILKIYDLNGKLVNTFCFDGSDAIEWNGTDTDYNTLPDGMYIYAIHDLQYKVQFSGKILLKR